MTFFALALLLLACLGCASTSSYARSSYGSNAGKWSVRDRALVSGLVFAHAIDYAQTRAALARGYAEANPALGANPASGKMVAYKLASLGAVIWLAERYPNFRTTILGTALGVEGLTVVLNARYVGFRMNF